MNDETETYDRATEICEEEGGVLARIFDQETNDFLEGLMGRGWFAMTDRRIEGLWETPDKRCMAWTNWNEGEPNDSGDEDCAEILDNKKWNDMKCDEKRRFTCQWFSEGT